MKCMGTFVKGDGNSGILAVLVRPRIWLKSRPFPDAKETLDLDFSQIWGLILKVKVPVGDNQSLKVILFLDPNWHKINIFSTVLSASLSIDY
jgi:hypothetical protein